nr:coiled-coil domain-containing protein 50 [Vulpes vulpes]
MPETQPGSRKSQPRNQSPGGEADSVLGDPRALVEAFRSPRTRRRRGPGGGSARPQPPGVPRHKGEGGGGRRADLCADLCAPAARRPGYRPAGPPAARRPGYKPVAPAASRRGYRPAASSWSQARLQTHNPPARRGYRPAAPRWSQAGLQTRRSPGLQARLQTRSPQLVAGWVTDPLPPAARRECTKDSKLRKIFSTFDQFDFRDQLKFTDVDLLIRMQNSSDLECMLGKQMGKVCRDFAVLEDHTLAHSLQEQEIEHHLASNIQRNRLVQHDLQVAKQLQEEDLKAQAQLQKRYKDLEQQDCEIAQEIQEKLAIEAERRRIQEKKDEDIARLLQEKELQEEKKRKKHFPESSGSSAYGDSYYYENGDQPQSRRARELGSGVSRSCRLQSDGNIVKQRNKKLKHPVENLEELEDHCSSGKFLSSRSLGTLRANPQIDIEQRERKRSDHERRRRPPLPKISGEVFLSTGFDDGEAHSSHRTWNWEKQSRHQDRLSPKSSQKAGLHCKEAVYGRDNGQGEHRERKHRPRTPPFPESEEQLQLHDTGMKPRVVKEADSAPSRVAHRDQEWYDAEIARKLQEEEILATQVDMRAAQVAQDEEIARLLMAEEKKAYKKAKEREKSSLDKRKHDSDWKPKTTKSAHSKSKESDDPHRSKNDRPARPPPPTMTEAEDLDYTHFTNQHNSTRHFSKSESSHKGFHHKQ